MHRLLIGSLALALLVVTSVCADEEKKSDKPGKPSEMFKELIGKFREAKDKEARDSLLKTYAKKFIDYAKANKTDESGAEALMYVLQFPVPPGKDSPKAEAMALLNSDFVKNPKIGKMIRRVRLSPEDEDAVKFVEAVFTSNPDKVARAYAAKSLIKYNEQLLTIAERLKEKEIRERIEKSAGKEMVKRVLANAEKADKSIKAYQEKLEGDLKGVFVNLSVGQPAPNVTSQDLEGKKVQLSDYKGKVVVLDIWATWCGPCKAMIPHTRELVKKMANKPFVFVSISADAKKETVTNFIKDTPMPWTHWYNGATGGIIEDWEVEYFPTIYILDHKGVIRYKDLRGEKMDEAVEKLVKEAQGDKKAKTE